MQRQLPSGRALRTSTSSLRLCGNSPRSRHLPLCLPSPRRKLPVASLGTCSCSALMGQWGLFCLPSPSLPCHTHTLRIPGLLSEPGGIPSLGMLLPGSRPTSSLGKKNAPNNVRFCAAASFHRPPLLTRPSLRSRQMCGCLGSSAPGVVLQACRDFTPSVRLAAPLTAPPFHTGLSFLPPFPVTASLPPRACLEQVFRTLQSSL